MKIVGEELLNAFRGEIINIHPSLLPAFAGAKAIEQAMYGMYFPGPGEYDLDNDKKADSCLWTGTKPATSCAQVLQIGRAIKLSGGTSGYVDFHQETEHVFDEKRDYFYPIPLDDLSLNPNLKQNPEWPTIGSEDN